MAEQYPVLLSLRVDLKCSATRSKGPLLMQLNKFVSNHASRLVHLHSAMCHHGNSCFFAHTSMHLPVLSKLTFWPGQAGWCEDEEPAWDGSHIDSAPLLHTLTFAHGYFPDAVVWRPSVINLTLVDMSELETDGLPIFLSTFPNLKTLRLDRCKPPPFSSRSELDGPVLLSDLRKIVISGEPTALIQKRKAFAFQNIHEVVMKDVAVDPADLTRFFRHIGSLAQLVLCGSVQDISTAVDALLDSAMSGGSARLPEVDNLWLHTNLHVRDTDADDFTYDDFCWKVRTMLSMRTKRGVPVRLLRIWPTIGATHEQQFRQFVQDVEVDVKYSDK
jgi:hypothetical protein